MRVFRFADLISFFLSRRWPREELLRSIPFIPALDPIREAVAEGIAAGNAKRRPTQEIRMRARAIRDQARATSCHETAISELLVFVSDYPGAEEFQKVVARLFHEMHDDEGAFHAWLGIGLRFPDSMDAFHNLVTLTHRHKGPSTVRTIILARFPRMPKRLDQLLAYAEACDVAGATAPRRAAFVRLARMFEKRNDFWLVATAWLEEEVRFHRSAVAVLRRLAAGTALRPPVIHERQRLHAAIGHSERDDFRTFDKDSVASVNVLEGLFDRVLRARQPGVSAWSREAAPVVLLTSSLGAGGAERQLVNTAVGLSEMNLEQRRLQDGLILDPVNVVTRSLRDRKDGAFYLADLQRAGIQVGSYREFPDFAGNLATSAVRPALSALGFLPWSTAEAVIKLTDRLQAMNPEVVHIWQDGLVYAAGLAALLAGVPRIILSGRSAPPPDRRERYLVEYDIIYRSMLRASGVKLSVNSRHAAKRYAAWLDIDPELITVIPNGVARASCAGNPASETVYSAFEARTGQSTLTLGAVMRIDEVKRPLLWIEAAASLLGKVPNARFIIVGDGPFRTRVERRAEALGIVARCLFVGRSDCVGYWLSKMDILMLLSEHEGLPNALIEAQLAGVPVITSPAGGAPETLIPGTTGIVTSASPTPYEVADLIAGLVGQTGRLEKMGIAGERWAREAFPIPRMLSNTLEMYMAAGRGALLSVSGPRPAAAIVGPRYQNIGR
jgi:glycosyltransferase involved in cell wall biosynthesis